MEANWLASFKKVETWEGWHLFTDDRFDPGGATYSGVIQRTYNAYRTTNGLPLRSVKYMTDDECAVIMHEQFWMPVRADALPAGVDYLMYDIAVNMGPVTAVKFLQTALKLKVDGHIGMVTVAAAKQVNTLDLIKNIAALRMSRWHALSTWWRYGKGWTSRGEGSLSYALMLYRSSQSASTTAGGLAAAIKSGVGK